VDIDSRIYILVKSVYTYPVELLVRKKMKLKKNNVYIVRLVKEVQSFLAYLEVMHEPYTNSQPISKKYLTNSCCKKAYLRGAFLAAGSVNNPETTSYQLELLH